MCKCVFLCLTSDVGPWGKQPGFEVSEIRCADKLVLPWGATKQPITQTRTHTLSICCTFSLWSWPRGAPQLLFSLFRRPAFLITSRSFTSPSIFPSLSSLSILLFISCHVFPLSFVPLSQLLHTANRPQGKQIRRRCFPTSVK